MPLPLSGITVVSLEQAIAAPFASRQLADLGARVIKIERPGPGDFARAYDSRVNGMASHFAWVNRSKESLTLDLKQPDARSVLDELLARADVFIQNLAPGACARMGLDFDTLHQVHPSLIVCDISGYGQGGPYETRKAYDLLVQAESGFLSVTGNDNDVAKAGCSIADISAGMYAYSGILAALLERKNTGCGTRVEVSMLESMVEWMGFPMYYAYDGASPPARSGASHATIYPYGPFSNKNGDTVILGIQNEREWAVFCEHVILNATLASDPLFCTNSLRHQHREALQAIILDAFADLSLDQIVDRLDTANIANARLNDMQDVWDHPQLKARKRWRTVETPQGPIAALVPPAVDALEPRMDPIPAVGEHVDKILEELGYTESEIALMRATGSV